MVNVIEKYMQNLFNLRLIDRRSYEIQNLSNALGIKTRNGIIDVVSIELELCGILFLRYWQAKDNLPIGDLYFEPEFSLQLINKISTLFDYSFAGE